jgi:hypothetical protein
MNNRAVIRLLVLCIAALFLAAACTGTAVQKASDAKIALTPPAGKKGAAIAINGTGFKPGEVIDITLDLADGRLVGLGTTKVEEIKADAAGLFKADSGIPTVAKPGTYKVTAEGDKGSVAKAELVVQP